MTGWFKINCQLFPVEINFYRANEKTCEV